MVKYVHNNNNKKFTFAAQEKEKSTKTADCFHSIRFHSAVGSEQQ
jgi:hypothetical protein